MHHVPCAVLFFQVIQKRTLHHNIAFGGPPDIIALRHWNCSVISEVSCRYINAEAFSAERDACRLEIVNPAIENTRSDGAEVAEMHNIWRARRLRIGKSF